MEIPKIHESEYRFCLIVWEHEPITAVELDEVQHMSARIRKGGAR